MTIVLLTFLKKLPWCLALPTGTTSEPRRLTERISRQNPPVGASVGNMTRLGVMFRIVPELQQTVRGDTVVTKTDSVTKCETRFWI